MARRRPAGILLAIAAALAIGAQGCSCGARDEACDGQLCGGACVDPSTAFLADPHNCGGCGVRCGAGATCAGGVCQCGSLTRCDGLVPRCRDLQTDAAACGACTTSCAGTLPGSACAGGACTCAAAGLDDCGTFCTDTRTDPANCLGEGGCGHPCPLAGAVCLDGTCACPASRPDPCPAAAPTACVDLDGDPSNCGACGHACELADAICASGTCACPPSHPDACPAGSPAACVDLTDDPSNCGGCGITCPSGATCTASACECPAGRISCGGACIPCAGGACVDGACLCPSGPAVGCDGLCCAGGTRCCSDGACEKRHSNGLGGSYFNCDAPYPASQTTRAAAISAADAWNPGIDYDGTTQCGTYCLGRQTATQCAVWCYGISPLAGRVALDAASPVCTCPTTASPAWD